MTLTSPVAFEKMSGTGNDFIIIDNREAIIPLEKQQEFAKKVCRRMFSVGADGLILIEPSETADFSWRFYNADGSIAEMCGNGARCAARFAFNHGIAEKQMRFETIAGVVEAELASDEQSVRILMTPPHDFRFNMSVNLGDMDRDVCFVNTGVPHAVIFVDRDNLPVKKWGRKVRFHEMFQPAGANVNFAQITGENQLYVRTYERGIEDETMACGTGAAASAVLAGMLHGFTSPVEVKTSGGENLTVIFEMKKGQAVQKVYLQGPARRIYTGTLTAESLL